MVDTLLATRWAAKRLGAWITMGTRAAISPIGITAPTVLRSKSETRIRPAVTTTSPVASPSGESANWFAALPWVRTTVASVNVWNPSALMLKV